jgi:hypothetical protein
MAKAAGAPLKPVHVPNPRPVPVKRIKLEGAQDGPHHRGLEGNLVDMGPAARNIKSAQQVY